MTQATKRNAVRHNRHRPSISQVVVTPRVSHRPTARCSIPLRAITRERKPDLSAVACASKAHRMAATIRAHVPADWFVEGINAFDTELCDIVENLEAMTPHKFPGDCADSHVDDLNQLLARIFDWADDTNVCLGL